MPRENVCLRVRVLREWFAFGEGTGRRLCANHMSAL